MGMYGGIYALTTVDYEHVRRNPEAMREFTDFRSPQASNCDLQKAWHGLHYLLTGQAGDADLPLGFMLAGGEPIKELDASYDPARWIAPVQVRLIHQAISPMTEDQLWNRFDSKAMWKAEIYPMIWEEEEADLREEYMMYFRDLKKCVAEAAEKGMGLVVLIE